MSQSNYGTDAMAEMMRPFGAVVEMQRRSLEQAQEATREGFELQKRLVHVAIENMEAQRNVQEKSSELTRTSAEASLDAMEEAVPGDEQVYRNLHQMVADQFDAMDEMSAQTWEAFRQSMEENAEAYDEFVDQYAEFVDDSFETYLESVSDVEAELDEESFGDAA
jgi:DNA anti-recombination protein RmuC